MTAANPESGTISYQYDSNGNLTSKTDARSITTTYSYDALNRVTQRSYSGESGYTTPTVTYTYGTTAPAIGQLTKVSSSVSATEYTGFDILGRVTGHKQTTDGENYETEYVYNLSGALIEQTYPSGRKVKNVIDNNGFLSMVQSRKSENHGYWNYAKNLTYNAAGAVTSMQLGNNRWESTQFNSRLQPTQITLGITPGATNLLKLNYSYGTTQNNGNVLSQTITVPTVGQTPGFIAVQSYEYDSLNRLKSAEETIASQTSWKQTFTFDRYGNRNFDEANTTFTGFEKLCASGTELCAELRKILNPSVNQSNNRLSSSDDYVFDNAGNTTEDAQGRIFIYDAENKQTEVRDSQQNVIGQYCYDGDGKRIKRIVPATSEVTIFVYSAGGQLVAEYSTEISQDPKVNYITADHLGSPRMLTDENGATISRRDFHPFGEEILTTHRHPDLGYTVDDVRQKFTTYERDGETALDFAQARYFNAGFGRFVSPDDFLNDTINVDPQSWNLYAYVRNNPLNFIDPLGEKATITSRYDEETGITTISISASFAVYGASGQGVTQEDLNRHATLLAQGIMETYNTSFVHEGRVYVVETQIDVSVYADEAAAVASGAGNLVELGNFDLVDKRDGSKASGHVFAREGEAFDRMQVPINFDPRSLMENDSEYKLTYAHEFGHLLGVGDRSSGLMNSELSSPRLEMSDFLVLFGRESRVTVYSQPPVGRRGTMGFHPATTELTSRTKIGILGLNTPSFQTRRTSGKEGSMWVRRNKR